MCLIISFYSNWSFRKLRKQNISLKKKYDLINTLYCTIWFTRYYYRYTYGGSERYSI